MTGAELVTFIASILSGIIAAVVTVRKAAPGMMASLMRRSAEQAAVEKHPVAVVGDNEDERMAIYEQLVALKFSNVRSAPREKYERRGNEAVVLLVPLIKIEGEPVPRPAFDLRAFAASGVSEGLLYVRGTVQPPSGRWTFANSEISLHARLIELVRFIRAGVA
jgi:hypothetical protein